MINRTHRYHRQGSIKRGFTIVETLIAVLVLSVAMAGALALAARGLDVIVIARQEVNAVYLAQDAMEYIRYARDSHCLSSGVGACSTSVWLGNTPTTNLSTLCSVAAGGCYIDTISGVINSCGIACPTLNYDPNAKAYTYATGPGIIASGMTRSIYVQTPPSALDSNTNEASTTVIVSWRGAGGMTRAVSMHADLFNWQ